MRFSLQLAALALTGLPLAALPLAAPAAGGDEWPHYQFQLTIDPPTHRLQAITEVTLPPALAGQTVEFLLGENFRVTGSKPAPEKLADAGSDSFAGINGTSEDLANRRGIARYRLSLPAGVRSFRLEYEGLVDLPPTTSPEEYARSFSETPGIIEPRGIYLAGSTVWYPQFIDVPGTELRTFTMTINTPEGWHIIAPGNGVSTGDDGMARWESPSAVDEISVSGGPLIPYAARSGRVEGQVYLRKDDPALAQKYLDATGRYIRMYNDLLGAYPYDKFALVENFWETGYGMPSYTLLGSQIIRFPFILTSSYPHEILHNWWGNSVYVDYATGNWAEGLTSYLADHLMKEGDGLGHEYRRDTLKKYRDYASTAADFPLVDFRSRHSAVTESVGYGKTLMGFHMLRRELGDAAFRQGLATFYKDYRGQRASWADAQTAFEKTSGRDLERFFSDLTTRVGAANLAVEDVQVEGRKGAYTVTGTLRQRQDGPYDLQVPVVVSTANGLVSKLVRSSSAETRFSIETSAEPQLLAVDPEFDLFRVLDARETAPSIGQLFGATKVTAVLPSASPAEAQAWRDMLYAWQSPSREVAIVTDEELKELPADRAVWLLGRQNKLAPRWFASEPSLGLAVGKAGIGIDGSELPFANHSHVLTRRHPAEPKLAVAWIAADPVEAVTGIVRKLPHYGKYSWLGFEGPEATNVAKGEWAATDSPLLVNLANKGAPAVLPDLPRRAPLAAPPPVFSAARLMDHVKFLAAPAQEGRGFDTAGLDAAGDYIRDHFIAAGLQPGGDNGTWFQSFTATGGREQKERSLRNVVGVLPGANPDYRDQAALLTAHYDHLGFGWPGGRADAIGQLHPGADDNASGVAVMLEIAHQMASAAPPPRTVVFVAFSGEEAGLMGSRHFVKAAGPVPVTGIYGVINLDTVGQLGEQPLSILASESAREWPFVFSGITAVSGVPTRSVPGASQSSDQQSFIDAGIPGVQLFTAATLDYHRPSDTADKVDAAGLSKVATVAREAVGYLSSTDKPLTVTGAGAGAAANAGPGTGPSRRVSLGAIPDFAFQGTGLRLEGVVPESPASRVGMKAGDVITRMGGEPVKDLGSFNAVLRTFQPGDRVPVAWISGEQAKEAEVELTAR